MKKTHRKGLKLRLIILYTCVISGTVTYLTLTFAAAAGKKQAAMRTVVPNVVRYEKMGYGFDTVTSKKNLLLSITNGGELRRTHLFTIDEDKHTLDVLELPPQTRISADGFEGTVGEAYESEVYKEIISRVLMLKVDGTVSIEADTISRCASALGGIPIQVNDPVTIGDITFGKGKRSLVGTKAGLIASDGDAYVSGQRGRIEIYRKLLASFLTTMEKKGALSWFPALMDIIINEAKTEMDISELLKIISIADSVSEDKISIFLLPGCGRDGIYFADAEKAALVLNDNFRVKGSSFDYSRLGLAYYPDAWEEYADLKQKIKDI